MQIENLVFPSAADISILDENAASLDITEGANSYLKFNTVTSSESVIVGQTLDINTGAIDMDGQTTDFNLKTSDALALEFKPKGGSTMVTFDTATPKVIVTSKLEVDGVLDVDGTSTFSDDVNFDAGTTTISDAVLTTANIDGGTIDGSALNNCTIGNATPALGEFTGIRVDASGYANFGATKLAPGYGIRDNGPNVIEIKNNAVPYNYWTPITSILPPNYITGFITSNHTDADHDIAVTAGHCIDSTNSTTMAGASLTKEIDAEWEIGSGGGFQAVVEG